MERQFSGGQATSWSTGDEGGDSPGGATPEEGRGGDDSQWHQDSGEDFGDDFAEDYNGEDEAEFGAAMTPREARLARRQRRRGPSSSPSSTSWGGSDNRGNTCNDDGFESSSSW